MTEVRQGPTPRVRFREVSIKRELTVVPNKLQNNSLLESVIAVAFCGLFSYTVLLMTFVIRSVKQICCTSNMCSMFSYNRIPVPLKL